jgi:hypothetical protein
MTFFPAIILERLGEQYALALSRNALERKLSWIYRFREVVTDDNTKITSGR